MRAIFLVTLVLAIFIYGCSRKSKPMETSRIAFFPNGKGYIVKQPNGTKTCIESYDIIEVVANNKTPIYRINFNGCNAYGGIRFKFNIQNDSIYLFHSEEELKEDEARVKKVGVGKYPVIIRYSNDEVAGIPEDAEILVLESKWDSVIAEAKARTNRN